LLYISVPYCFKHFLMFFHQALPCLLIFKIFNPIAVNLFPQIIQHLEKPFILCCTVNDLMKFHICLCQFCQVSFFQKSLKFSLCICQFFQLLLGHPAACFFNCHLFQTTSH